jgi:Mg-chelatase subunit ChlD
MSKESLMHTVTDAEDEEVKDGKILSDAMNYGAGSFTPDLVYENLVKDYSKAEKLVGEKLIRFLTGYDPSYVEKNVALPEFKRELKSNIPKKFKELEKKGLLKDGQLTEKGIEISSIALYMEELDKFIPKGSYGEYVNRKKSHYGERSEVHDYKRGDRYKDIAVRKTVKKSIRRKHEEILPGDLQIFDRKDKSKVSLIYAIDSSGSMTGKKIGAARKAGIALSFKAIERGDKVGMIAFKEDVEEMVPPTNDFKILLRAFTTLRSNGQTNFVKTVEKASELFMNEQGSKHLILLSDALPTSTSSDEVLKAVSSAIDITISIVGISLNEEGINLARKIAELGRGSFHVIHDVENLDSVVLQDYYDNL